VVNSNQTIAELRANIIAAAAMLLTVTIGAFAFVTILHWARL
jgi:hypothetical protein